LQAASEVLRARRMSFERMVASFTERRGLTV
jgi:hypothetical protein